MASKQKSFFPLLKTDCCSSPQLYFLPFFVMLNNGIVSCASSFVNFEQKFIKLKKPLNCFTFSGTGKRWIASTLSGSIRIASVVSISPKKCISLRQKFTFSKFAVTCSKLILSNHISRFSRWSSKFSEMHNKSSTKSITKSDNALKTNSNAEL